MYEHLLVAVDDGPLAQHAVTHALELAKMLGARVTALTVEPPLPVVVVEQAAVAYDAAAFREHDQQCEGHARELLHAFGKQAQAMGVTFDGQFLISDDVAGSIVDVAERQRCDLIVMATHGRHGLDSLIHGSLAKSVLAHSKLPLLIVH